ncbi:hypothetical protein F5B17DRAFT_207091 [Nemania serpens]|nr:hypothetical protein F5B17DRAFT_207091 [Nemania serpens]
MHLFRRRHGTRTVTETPAASLTSRDDKAAAIKKVDEDNSPPPPSYEDSEDASLWTVLHDAETIVPLLWPSALLPPPPCPASLTQPVSPHADKRQDVLPPELNTVAPGKNREDAEKNPSTSAGETTILDVLANLATTPCGGQPFLSRIREFSDFYYAPSVIAGDEETPAIPTNPDPGSGSGSTSTPTSPTRSSAPSSAQAQQRKTLVLCARVLETYYASLGHAMMREPTTSQGNVPIMIQKTRLTQLAACAEPGCACGDYDEATTTTSTTTTATASSRTSPLSETQTTTTTTTTTSVAAGALLPQRCTCGHAPPSHTAAGVGMGIARLMRRFTNWRAESYVSLSHRTSSGYAKRHIGEIEPCGAPCAPLGPFPCPCPCRDYDKGRRTGRCARCGHYSEAHVPILIAQARRLEEKGLAREGGRKGGAPDGPSKAGAADPEHWGAEWELSWILIENAYLLLGQITTSLRCEQSSVGSSS